MKLHFWHYPEDIALSMKGDDEPKGLKNLTREGTSSNSRGSLKTVVVKVEGGVDDGVKKKIFKSNNPQDF